MDRIKKEGLEWIKAIIIGLIIFFIIHTFFFTNYVVEGNSMSPTLENGDKLIINKIIYRIGDIERFDIIVFHATEDEDYVKRVIGLPGDEISYKNDQLFINGEPVNEPFLDPTVKRGLVKFTNDFTLESITGKKIIPEGYIFVMGDNRKDSYDSRHFGLIPIEKVIGKVALRYWPFSAFDLSF